jgi:hypothetical protein
VPTLVHRCSFCGAPLTTGGSERAACAYCGTENHIAPASGGSALRLARAVQEAEDINAEAERKGHELSERMTRALTGGDPKAALVHMEGMMRAYYAPTIHLYRSMDPGNPQVEAALKQIDEAIDTALRDSAATWGVEYVPAGERSS